MWPFRPTLPEPEARRVALNCEKMATGLRGCVAANPGRPDVCSSLAATLDVCRARVVAPALAEKFELCVPCNPGALPCGCGWCVLVAVGRVGVWPQRGCESG